MKNSIFILLLLFIVFLSCNPRDKVANEISKVNVTINVSRFDQAFAKATPKDILVLKKSYPYLFPKQYHDSVWVSKLKDTIQIELFNEVDRVFPNFNEEAADIELLYKHLKYYYPNEIVPKVVTVTSEVDYRNRIILTDTLLLIGLDNYLGKDHKFYRGIQNYIAQHLDKEFLVSDVVSAFAKKKVPSPRERFFLSQLIYYGKELYLKDKLIPFMADAQKIGYSQEQLDWAVVNEQQIWRYFIERELLYNTDNNLATRFLDEAPFSKFQLELDNESPGRVGRYIGWQIVKAFMDNNTVTLEQLLSLPAAEIFKKSNYKPKK